MASFWHAIPFVRLLIPFAVGIGVNIFFEPHYILVFILFLFSSAGIWFSQKYVKIYLNWVTGICISGSFLCVGILLNKLQNQKNSPTHFSKINSEYLIVSIDELPVIKPKSVKAVVKVYQAIQNKTSVPVNGKLLVYFKKDSQSVALQYGQVLLVKAHYTNVNEPQNPNEFNYKRYLSFNQIFHQLFLDSGSYQLLSKNNGYFHFKIAYAIQSYIKAILSKYVITKSEIGVAQALLYGYDNDIDPDLLKAYSNTGTLHVLAVSGMHVGVIYFVLGFLLKPLDKKKKLKWIKYPILLSFVWCYSVLCGLSPSILRATVMISFFTIAEILNRKGNSYNTLAASAFLLICINTNIIANVGFQLSYLAVLGIISVNPVLYKQLAFSSNIMDGIWKIVAVSISAQFTTFPIGLLYFHQFPVYFLFSNLLIIPLTTLIIYSGIFLVIISQISFLAEPTGFVVKSLIAITNFLVSSVEKLPYAYVSGISITVFQTILIYLICFGIFIYLLQPIRVYLVATLSIALVFISITGVEKLILSQQQKLFIYHIKGHVALQAIGGNQSILIADRKLLDNADKFHFHIQQHIWASKIKQTDTVVYNGKPVIYTFNSSKLFIDIFPENEHKNAYVLITGNNFIPLEHLKQKENIKMLIINNSMSNTTQKLFEQFAVKNNIPYTMLAKSGYIDIEI